MASFLIGAIRIRHVPHCWIHTRKPDGEKRLKRGDWRGLKTVHKELCKKHKKTVEKWKQESESKTHIDN